MHTKDEIPAGFWQGVEQFNQGEYYACHDTLEALWMEAMEPEKRFYQGILQVAVGLYHLSNENWRGTVTSIGEGVRRLDYYQPDYSGVDVESFIAQIRELLIEIQQAGADGVSKFVTQLQQNPPQIQRMSSY
ncbi:MAG: DUF309 domain-containing protein [Microcoleaceae cyanobacterium]